MFLASRVLQVHLIVRAGNVSSSMSDYLVQRITATPNILVRTDSQIRSLHGTTWLESVTIENRLNGSEETVEVCGLFVMIGAKPNTDWLGTAVTLILQVSFERGQTLMGRRRHTGPPCPASSLLEMYDPVL